MPAVPPPEGLTETDYEAIEAAVTETVRGRWFLGEFARRNRTTEMRQLLDAIGRLEATVTAGQIVAGQAALPGADPSVRLLIQRIKEVSAHLDGLAADMRGAGVDDRFAEAVMLQARAVAGMMRGGPPLAKPAAAAPLAPPAPPPQVRLPRATPLPAVARPPEVALQPEAAARPEAAAAPAPPPAGTGHPRLDALAALDRLTPAEKLALFS